MDSRSFDWPALMVLGLKHLGLSAQEFWALTPYEFSIKAGLAGQEATHLGRLQLNELLAQYPDK